MKSPNFSGPLSYEDPEKPGVKGEENTMKLSVEVKTGPVTHRVSVMAASIERALKLAAADLPGAEARVLFPINPDAFFGDMGPHGPLSENVEYVEPVEDAA